MNSRIKQSLLVWDQNGEPQTDQQILLWNGYAEKKNQRSVLKTLEKNSNQIPFYNLIALSYREKGQLLLAEKIIILQIPIN